MNGITVGDLLSLAMFNMKNKWGGEKITFTPSASTIAVEDGGIEGRYSCMRYIEACIFTIGKKKFLVAYGKADDYYLTDHIDSDLIVINLPDKLVANADKIKILIKNSAKEFASSVWIGLKDGRLIPGELLKQTCKETLTEISFMKHIESNAEHPITYAKTAIAYLLQNLEKVVMNL